MYEILGVPKNASEADITKAYRALARKYHPDRNPGDKEAEAKFKEIQNAYDVLSDTAKRANYDRFGSPDGARGGFSGFSGGSGGISPDMMEEILRQFGGGGGGFNFDFGGFGGGSPRQSRRAARPPEDVEHDITVPFLTAVTGGKIDLSIDGQAVGVTVPAGAKDGQSLRLKGILPNGGNLKLKLHVEPHPYFRREGDDVAVDVPISLSEAVLGAKVDAPKPDGGTVTVTVPPGTSSGAKLRVRKQGGGGKDLYVVLKVVVPKHIDAKSRELIEEFARLNSQTPRDDVPWK
jgi:DnaJ-class molecular chaperone